MTYDFVNYEKYEKTIVVDVNNMPNNKFYFIIFLGLFYKFF